MFKDPSERTKDDRGSGFRSAVIRMKLPKSARALDLGAGGFAGTTTTKHLVDFCATIDAVELDPVRAAALRDAFPDKRVNVIEGSAYDTTLTGPYDIIVSDIDTGQIPAQATTLAQNCRQMLNRGGFYVIVFIFDLKNVFKPEAPMVSPIVLPILDDFMASSFGTTRVTTETMTPFYKSMGYEVCGLVNKYLPPRDRGGIGWLILRAQIWLYCLLPFLQEFETV